MMGAGLQAEFGNPIAANMFSTEVGIMDATTATSSGYATFRNPTSDIVTVNIFTSGREVRGAFLLPPRTSQRPYVRVGDTYAWTTGSEPIADDVPRYFIRLEEAR